MHIKPKKSLGQNFLFDKNIQRKIIEAFDLTMSDTVLEIGSGRGELTGLIADKVKKVYSLEIDNNLCQILRERFKDYPNIEVINQDILKFNFTKIFRVNSSKLKIVGNIPYYISSPIIEKLLGLKEHIRTIILTVQKEFARRLVASPGSKEYGSFSCFLQYHTEPRILLNIKSTSFFPKPKVDSSLLELKIRVKPKVFVRNEELFFKIIRAAFNKRRKTLRNSLRGIMPEQNISLFSSKYNLSRNIRPEDLSLEDFGKLLEM